MADKWEPGLDGIDAAKAWLRGDIKKRSPRIQAGRTLARMLRNNPEGHLLSILADAIEDGRLVMKRKPGRREANGYAIAAFIAQKVEAGVPVESAVRAAEDQFGRKHSTVYKAWTKWRRHVGR